MDNSMPPKCAVLWIDGLTQTDGFLPSSYDDLVAAAAIPSQYKEKKQIPAFLPSLAKAKTKAAVLEADAQTALVLDIDHGGKQLAEVKQELDELGCDYLAYSTFSSTQETPRWRIVLPLCAPVKVDDWLASQEYLADRFGADPCCCRIQQVSFVPAKPPNEFFEYANESAKGLLDIARPDWAEAVAQFQRAQEEQELIRFTSIMEPNRDSKPDSLGLFDKIRAAYPLPQLLLSFGFLQVGQKWLPPESESGSPGITLFPEAKAGLCHNSSCPLHSNGGRFDAVDVLLHYRYQDCWAALRDIESVKLGLNLPGQTDTISVSKAHEHTTSTDADADMPEQRFMLGERAELAKESQLVRYALEVADKAQFPECTAILSILGTFSGLSSAAYCTTYPDGERLNIGLFVVAEQPPGAAKSRVLNSFVAPAKERLAALNTAWQRETNEVDDGDTPRSFKAFATNGTTEAIEERIIAPNNGHFSLASSERGLTDVLLGLTRGKDHLNDNDLVLKGFAGEHHNSIRVTRAGYEGKIHGSIVLLAQPGSIDSVLSSSRGQGVAERFLLLAEPTSMGHRDWDKEEANTRSALSDRLSVAIDALCQTIAGLPSCNLDDTVSLRLSREGVDMIRVYRQKIEPELADGARYSHGFLRGAFGKVDIQIMKVATNLYLAEHLMLGKKISPVVESRWVRLALMIVDELLRELPRLLNDKGFAGQQAECEAVLNAFNRHKKRTERQVIQSRVTVAPFKAMTGNKSDAVRAALQRCVASGDLVCVSNNNDQKVYYRQ